MRASQQRQHMASGNDVPETLHENLHVSTIMYKLYGEIDRGFNIMCRFQSSIFEKSGISANPCFIWDESEYKTRNIMNHMKVYNEKNNN